MTLATWLVFSFAELLLCLTPGPAVLLVLSQGLSRGARWSVISSLGILSANAIYFIASATSLGAVLAASHKVFLIIKWAGGAYLIYQGAVAIFGRSEVIPFMGSRPGPRLNSRRQYAGALMLQLANPKALLFFTAFLPQFIAPAYPVATQVGILAITSIIIEFCVLVGYGLLAGKVARYAARPRFSRLINCLAGIMLIAAGVGMASLNRS